MSMVPRNPRAKRTRREPTPPPMDEASGSMPVQEQQTTDEQKRAIIQSWKVAKERGFELDGNVLFTKFYTLIDRLGWQEFAKHPNNPCLTLVHEFYAKLHKSSRPDEVKVFGRWVKYDAERINRALGIPPLDEADAFDELLDQDNRPSLDKMLHVLTLGRGGGLVPRTHVIKIGSLCEEARWWRKFMTGRILGSIKEGETTIDQQILLFCILLGRRFDVGKLINSKINEIKRKIRSDTMGKLALSYPSLITLLCKNVPKPARSLDCDNMQPITDRHISHASLDDPSVLEFHQTRWGNQGSPSWVQPQVGAEQLPSPPHDDDEDMQDQGHGSPHFAPFDQHAWQEFQNVQEQRYNELSGRMDGLNLRFDGVYGRMDGLQQQLTTMQARQEEFYGLLEAHFYQSSQQPPNP